MKYIDKYNIGKDFRDLKQDLNSLLKERDTINERINILINQVFDLSERFRNINPLYTLEFEIPDNSSIINKSINETNFWQNTGATIVAVKRSEKMILSPGPYFVFAPHDIIIVTGDTGISDRITSLIN